MALRRPLPVAAEAPRRVPRSRAAEWRWLAVFTGILLMATVVPVVVAALQAPPGMVFPGYVVIARDAYVYQALWHAGAAGDWLFRSRYTSEQLPGVLLYPWYLWSGHLLGGLPAGYLYHASRLVASGGLCVAIYGMAAELYRSVLLRRLAFVLAVFGGGVGTLAPSVRLGPLESRATEALVPGGGVADLIAMAPHLPLALALMCAIFVVALRLRRGTGAVVIGAGLAAVPALQLIYPQLALLAALVVVAWAILGRLRRPLLFAAAACLIQAPYLAYLAVITASNPGALAAVRSALDVGDPLGFLLLSHALATVLIIVALLKGRLRGDLLLPALWIVGMTLFMFAPGLSGYLGRSFMASSIPFALCSIPGLLVVLRRVRLPSWRRRAAGAMVAIGCLYGLVSLAQPAWIAAMRLDSLAEYEQASEATLLSRLAPRVSKSDLVLTTYIDGLFVPAQTDARVFAGHPDMTIDAARKAGEALAFFQRWPASQRDAFLSANKVDYVLTGDSSSIARLEGDPALRSIDREGNWVLYQVAP